MPALTPLVAAPYPLATDAPSGHSQIEAVARALEKATVVPVASTADRSAKFTAGVLREGSVCFNTGTRQLQAYTGGSWQTVWTLGDRAYQVVQTLPAAASNPGLICIRSSDDAMFFSDGAIWVRVTDNTDSRNAVDTFNGAIVTTSNTSGSYNPGGAGEPINVDFVVPDSGKAIITVCATMSIAGSGNVYFGSEVTVIGGATVVSWAGAQSARHQLANPAASSWTRMVNCGTNRAGQTLRCHGVHAVSVGSSEGTFNSRQITVQPVR